MNLKSYTKRRKVFDAFVAFACAVFAAQAETVDLAGASLTVKDIAAAFHMTENAVSVRLNRIRNGLKAYLVKEGYYE